MKKYLILVGIVTFFVTTAQAKNEPTYWGFINPALRVRALTEEETKTALRYLVNFADIIGNKKEDNDTLDHYWQVIPGFSQALMKHFVLKRMAEDLGVDSISDAAALDAIDNMTFSPTKKGTRFGRIDVKNLTMNYWTRNLYPGEKTGYINGKSFISTGCLNPADDDEKPIDDNTNTTYSPVKRSANVDLDAQFVALNDDHNAEMLAGKIDDATNAILQHQTLGFTLLGQEIGMVHQDVSNLEAQFASFKAIPIPTYASLASSVPCCVEPQRYVQPYIQQQNCCEGGQRQPVVYQQRPTFGQTWVGEFTAYAAGGLLKDGIERLFFGGRGGNGGGNGGGYYNPNGPWSGGTQSNQIIGQFGQNQLNNGGGRIVTTRYNSRG